MWYWRPAQIGLPQYSYEVVVSLARKTMVWAGWLNFPAIPNEIHLVTSTGWGGCTQCYAQYGDPMWYWGQAQIGPPQCTYEVVVSFVGETMVWGCWFTFTTIPNEKYLSLALDEADVHSATLNMVTQCGTGGKPKLDLFSTRTRL